MSIGDDAFARCFKLHSITLPDGIESINSGTFQHCSNLKKVIVPATLKSIDRIAFSYCRKLKEIALTDTVNYIFEDAFDGCISLSIVAPVGSYARNYAEKHGYIMNKSKNKVDGSDNTRESSSNRYAFISYSSKNQSMADSFRTLLNQNGVKTWMAPGDIPVGSSYMKEINHALKDCACLVLLLSNAAQGSLWVIKEVERAVNYHKPIIPVQIEEVILNDEFEFVLGSYQVVAVQRIDQDSAETKKVLNSIIAATGMSSNLPIETSKTYYLKSSYLKSSEDLNLIYPLKPGLNIIGTDLNVSINSGNSSDDYEGITVPSGKLAGGYRCRICDTPVSADTVFCPHCGSKIAIEKPSVQLSQVEFSAIAPKQIVKGEYSIIDIVMYEEAY